MIEEKLTDGSTRRYVKGRLLGKVFFSIYSGRICEMLWMHLPANGEKVCGQGYIKIKHWKIKSQDKTCLRDQNSPVSFTSQYCPLLAILRRRRICVYFAGEVPQPGTEVPRFRLYVNCWREEKDSQIFNASTSCISLLLPYTTSTNKKWSIEISSSAISFYQKISK